jgi:hypothetical protein
MEGFIRNNPSLKTIYIKNNNNIGSDANFLKVLSTSKTKYCWIFSDDDSILEGSLKILTDTLEQSDLHIGFICSNYYISTSSDRTAFNRIGDDLYSNLCEFSIESNIGFSMISACIFKKEVVDRHLDKFKDFLNTGYPHLFWIMICAQHDTSMKLMREPLFRVNSPSVSERRLSGREDNDNEFYMNSHLSFLRFMKSLSRLNRPFGSIGLAIKKIRIIEDENINQVMYHKMCFGYKYVSKYPEYIFRMWSALKFSPIFYLLHIPLLLLPASVSKLGIPLRCRYLIHRGNLKRLVSRFWAV